MIMVPLNVVGYCLVAVIACVICIYAWKRRAMPGGLYFCSLMVAVVIWALTCAGEQFSYGMALRDGLELVEYLLVTMAGPIWLLFSLDYGYRGRWPITWKYHLIWLPSLAVMVLALTNAWHGLVWPSRPGDMQVMGYGPVLLLNLLYTYALLLAGLALLMGTAVRSYRSDKLKVTSLVLGTLLPFGTSVLYMLGETGELIALATPLAFSGTILLYAYSIFGQRLFDLVPAAREAAFRSMYDGVIVLDGDHLVADINPAAMRVFGKKAVVIGQPVESILYAWPELLAYCTKPADEPCEVMIEGPDGPTWLDVRVSGLRDDAGRTYGKLVALRNVTKRKLAEDGLKRSNEALQAEVNERKRAEESLGASLKEKELLLKEIHHRVKNNLQIVSSLLSLQIGSTSNESTSASLKESQNRIRSMALIHEKLYQSSDLAVIDFREYVNSLVVSLSRSYVLNPRLNITVDIEDVALDIDAAIPCGLIINELISNCLKYAYPGGGAGEIRVSLRRSGGQYLLTVSDDGVGLPAGVDYHDTPSLGLQLVNTLVGQLNGTIDCPAGKGTTFIISFRVNAGN